MDRETLQQILQLTHREHFRKEILKPAIEMGWIEMTIPDKPNSINQKYRLTPKGIELKEALKKQNENK